MRLTIGYNRSTERTEVHNKRDGKLIGYVDTHDMVFGIDAAGYAEPIDHVEHNSEVIPLLEAWLDRK